MRTGECAMSLTVGNLMKKAYDEGISLLGGKNGLSRRVDWVHMVETPEIAKFLDGYELALTTGIGLGEKVTIMDIAEAVFKRGGSGMVINIGPYISNVPDEIRTFANDNSFPVYIAKWEVHMANIMRICCIEISIDQQRSFELSTAMHYAMTLPEREEMYLPVFMEKGFIAGRTYETAVIEIVRKADRNISEDNVPVYSHIDEMRLDSIEKNIGEILRHSMQETAEYIENGRICVLIGDQDESMMKEKFRFFEGAVARQLKPGEIYRMGQGEPVYNLRNVSKSYKTALRILKLMNLKKDENKVISEEDLGMARLLLHVDSKKVIMDYYKVTVYPLAEYDRMNRTDLLEVLRCYLESNGSVQKVAGKLFVHRNTINYRLENIERILGRDLRSFTARNELMTGLICMDIVKSGMQ